MTAVTYTDGTEERVAVGEGYIIYWKSPSTMDSGDTVVLPTITGKSIVIWGCWDTADNDTVTCTLSTATVTIDASGGATNSTYVLCWGYA